MGKVVTMSECFHSGSLASIQARDTLFTKERESPGKIQTLVILYGPVPHIYLNVY